MFSISFSSIALSDFRALNKQPERINLESHSYVFIRKHLPILRIIIACSNALLLQYLTYNSLNDIEQQFKRKFSWTFKEANDKHVRVFNPSSWLFELMLDLLRLCPTLYLTTLLYHFEWDSFNGTMILQRQGFLHSKVVK